MGLRYFAGRVGDSPLVGCGLYVDNAVGAAVATGDGEEIMKTCLSFLVRSSVASSWCPNLSEKSKFVRGFSILTDSWRRGGRVLPNWCLNLTENAVLTEVFLSNNGDMPVVPRQRGCD